MPSVKKPTKSKEAAFEPHLRGETTANDPVRTLESVPSARPSLAEAFDAATGTKIRLKFLTVLASVLPHLPELMEPPLAASVIRAAGFCEDGGELASAALRVLELVPRECPRCADAAFLGGLKALLANPYFFRTESALQIIVQTLQANRELGDEAIAVFLVRPSLWGSTEDKAREALSLLLDHRPELVHVILPVCKVSTKWEEPEVRARAQSMVRAIVSKFPNLITAELVVETMEIACSDECEDTRRAAWRTVATLMGIAPQLANEDLCTIAANTAIAPSDGWYAGEAARGALGTIVEHRPELATRILDIVKAGTIDSEHQTRNLAYAALGTVIQKRPELADQNLILAAIRTRRTDEERYARDQAQNVLNIVVDKRPQLVGEDLINCAVEDPNPSTLAIIGRKCPEFLERLRRLTVDRCKELLRTPEDSYYAIRYIVDLLLQWPDLADQDLTAFLLELRDANIHRETVNEALGIIGEHRPDLVQPDPNRTLEQLTASLKAMTTHKA